MRGILKLIFNCKRKTVWLTQDQMATFYRKSNSTINEYFIYIYAEKELE